MPSTTLKIPPITLKWSEWHAWDTLCPPNHGSTVRIPVDAGVYEVRKKHGKKALYVGRSVKIRQRIHAFLQGLHKPGSTIVGEEGQQLYFRWATTDRPACAEEALLKIRKPKYNKQG